MDVNKPESLEELRKQNDQLRIELFTLQNAFHKENVKDQEARILQRSKYEEKIKFLNEDITVLKDKVAKHESEGKEANSILVGQTRLATEKLHKEIEKLRQESDRHHHFLESIEKDFLSSCPLQLESGY